MIKLTNVTCQRVGCDNPSAYGVRFVWPEKTVGSTLGICGECRAYFLEAVASDILRQAAEGWALPLSEGHVELFEVSA